MLKNINWEKIGVYIAVLTAFFIAMNKIIDLSERTAKVEVKIEHLERGGK